MYMSLCLDLNPLDGLGEVGVDFKFSQIRTRDVVRENYSILTVDESLFRVGHDASLRVGIIGFDWWMEAYERR
jgi:hypothetical protein